MHLTRTIAAAGVSCFIIGGCASSGSSPGAGGASANPSRPATYVVRPQDTLYGIAWRHNLDYRELARWNNIGSDYRLTIGQVLVLQPTGRAAAVARPPARSAGATAPPPSARTSTPGASPSSSGQARANGAARGTPQPLDQTPAAAARATGSHEADDRAIVARANEPRTAETSPAPALIGRGAWVWPTDGGSSPRPVPGGGILLLGKLGQDIRAAGPGRVVYIGSGLRGYGNLIIVKHDNNVLSSYAHNREMLVHEGQDVTGGQIIAHMGTGPHQVSALYFEIRVNGKPVDPLPYLPER